MKNLETLLKEYSDHVAERAAKGIPPLPLNAEQTNCITKLLERESNYDSSYLLKIFHMIKTLQIIACKTITVLIKAIVSASLLSPTFSPRAFAQILQSFFTLRSFYIG